MRSGIRFSVPRLLSVLCAGILAAACSVPGTPPSVGEDTSGGATSAVAGPSGAPGSGLPVGPASTGPVQAGGFPDAGGPPTYLTDARTARMDGFDRIVLEFTREVPSYRVAYVEPPVRAAGSGAVVPIDGSAFLQISVTPASTVDLSGEQPRQTYTGPDRIAPPNGEVVNEVVRTGDFEAMLTWTAGFTQRLPFAVETLADPARLVIDVLHAPADGGGSRLQPIGEAGTGDVSAGGAPPPVVVTDVRLGGHEGFDRIVFETAGDGRAGYEIGYTQQPREQGSGAPVQVPGDAALAITLTDIALPGDAPPGAQPWDGPQRQRIAGSQVLVELVEGNLFEGRYTFYAGTTGQQPFAVGRLDDPNRIVIDILTGDADQPAG